MENLGHGAFHYVKPEFYDLAQQGANIVVAGLAFGSGSSREQAPKCLLQAGIQAVIARSFAFIYGRNQVNNGLLGICLDEDKFYEIAQEGEAVTIDMELRTITCGGHDFKFLLDPIEEQLLSGGGLLSVYEKYGQSLFRRLQSLTSSKGRIGIPENPVSQIEW
jgi:homoaconitate hydratase